MSGFQDSSTGFCYRHPSRQSFVLCQRCGRTICPECQTQAAVGVICPECLREQRDSAPRVVRSSGYRGSGGGIRTSAPVRSIGNLARNGHPVMTYAIMAASLLVFILSFIPGVGAHVVNALLYNYTLQPWRLVTTIFVTTNLLSVFFSLLTLWFMGRVVEQLLGSWRFLVLYLLGGMAGGVSMLLVTHSYSTGGTFASIFGLFGAMVMIQRHLGGQVGSLLVFLAINLVLNVFLGSWLVLVVGIGGFAGGVLVGYIFSETRQVRRRPIQIWSLIALAVVLFAIGLYPAA